MSLSTAVANEKHVYSNVVIENADMLKGINDHS